MNKTILALSMGMAVASQTALAVELQPGNVLTIDDGSSFQMGGPATSIIGNNGLTVGLNAGDTGTGSHNGQPNAGDVGAVTKPWLFFCNTGYDYMSFTNGSGSFGGSTEAGVDMSSWTITWNGIPGIPFGGCFVGDPANNGGFSGCDFNQDGMDDTTDSGIGTFSWSGVYGDSYTITHTARVPAGDPSGFGGVRYGLFLTGRVLKAGTPLPPTRAVVLDLKDGVVYECSDGGATVAATAIVITSDTNDIVSISWLMNGELIKSGESIEIFVPLGEIELAVEVKTLESGTFENARTIQVRDTKAPIIDAAFVNKQEDSHKTDRDDDKHSQKAKKHERRHEYKSKSGKVTIVYSATDACDDSPVVEATLGVDVASGDKIKFNHDNNKLTLKSDLLSDSVIMNVTATDESGRRAVLRKTLER